MTILVVDDDQDILIAVRMALSAEGAEVEACANPRAAIDRVKCTSFDVVLLDMNYRADTTSGTEGLDLIDALRDIDEHLALIVMTAWGSVDLAVEAMKRGAIDFIEKPWDGNERLLAVLNRGVEIGRLRRSEAALRAENLALTETKPGQADFVAVSDAMRRCLEIVDKVAASDIPLLITGENGTGKSHLGKYIHDSSDRREHSFVTVNMGGVMDATFESEVFGHVKGAYTGAHASRIGKVEMAEAGTLFLDEVANAPLNQQAKLLYLLEEKKFTRLGGSQEQTADVRIVSATNADLAARIEAGEFRQDLRYRLEGMPIEIPPLRERREDILPIAESIRKAGDSGRALRFDRDAVALLHRYPWPGNVRELRHVVERACLLARDGRIRPDDLYLDASARAHGKVRAGEAAAEAAGVDRSLQEVERDHISAVLATAPSVDSAATILGLSRSALYRKLEKYDIRR